MSTQVTSEYLLRLMELQEYRRVIMEAQDEGENVTEMLSHFKKELDELVEDWNRVKSSVINLETIEEQ